MRKREPKPRRSLSSAQATRKPSFDESQGTAFVKDNVVEQDVDLLSKVQRLLDGASIDSVMAISVTIMLNAIKQQAHGRSGLALLLYSSTMNSIRSTFFDVVLKEIEKEFIREHS